MAMDKPGKEKKKGQNKVVKYFKEVKSEMKKVAWPTYKQVQKNTIVVLVSILIVGAFIWVLDWGFGATLGKVVDRYSASNSAATDMSNLDMGDIDLSGQTADGAAGEGVPEGDVAPAQDGASADGEDADGTAGTAEEPTAGQTDGQ